jgi:hypothetical protein
MIDGAAFVEFLELANGASGLFDTLHRQQLAAKLAITALAAHSILCTKRNRWLMRPGYHGATLKREPQASQETLRDRPPRGPGTMALF